MYEGKSHTHATCEESWGGYAAALPYAPSFPFSWNSIFPREWLPMPNVLYEEFPLKSIEKFHLVQNTIQVYNNSYIQMASLAPSFFSRISAKPRCL